ncbi:MAG: polysaccharide biosynthesis protein [Rhodospirillales bacterium]
MKLLHRISGRGLIAFGHDIVMAGVSFIIAMYLRVGATDYRLQPELLAEGAVAMILIGAAVFWVSGLYRGVWRYASMDDLMAITRAATVTMLAFMVVMFAWSRMDDVPRSVPFINWFVLMALLGGPRFVYRSWKDRRIELPSLDSSNKVPVLLIGASDGADQFLRGLRQSADTPYSIAGILSEQPERVGRTIRGVDVIGTVADLETVVKDLKSRGLAPQRLVLTKDEITGAPVRDLLERAAALGLTLARIPRATDFQHADADGTAIQSVAIEDLLGRPQTPLERTIMRGLIKGRRIAVTGAGGSIGAELVRQIADFEPAGIDLIENNEYALYTIDRELAETCPDLPRRAMIADIRDRRRIEAALESLNAEIVFHAAALKHVPLVESNPSEGVRTNVLGTVNVADACAAIGVRAMVLVSTDKAINPTSVMGATKRAAEMYCQALDLAGGDDACRYVTVRFGNVLGSTGSVVPLFQRQLENGGPLTVTHPEMTRYFMTIREAVELILEASAIGSAGEVTDGRIFVLDMGEPVKIVDLARQMIRLSGKVPDQDVKIAFTGIRPGEKLYEEVFHDGETTVETDHAGLLLAAPRVVAVEELKRQLAPLLAAAENGDDENVRRLLHDLVPEYIEPTDQTPPKRAQST